MGKCTCRKPYDWKRVGEDSVRTHVANIVRGASSQGTKIILMSGRDSSCREETETWLKENNIPYDELHMRPEGDMRPDTEIKKEMFWPLTETFDIQMVIDDRTCMTDMWQDMGLNVVSVGDNRENF